MSIKEKIYNYFDKAADLRVLFVFDHIGMLQAEIDEDPAPWPDEYHYEVFGGNWFTTKVRLATDWKDKKVVLLFQGRQEPVGQEACLEFPLMSALKANLVFHEEDAIAFMQQWGIPMQFTDFFQRHITELLREKYSKVFTPYYSSGVFNFDYAYRGMLSVYLGSTKMLEWYQIVAQLIILCANENSNKADVFWNRLKPNAKVRANDVGTALAEKLTQMVGFSYDLTKDRPMDKVAEAMKYNAITQGMAVNEADPYKQLKMENSVRLQQLNSVLSSIKENTKLHEAFAPAFERLSENVREEKLIEVYGADVHYSYLSERMCKILSRKLVKEYLYSNPERLCEQLSTLLEAVAQQDASNASVAYYQEVARFYNVFNGIDTLKLNTPDLYISRYTAQWYLLDTYYRHAISNFVDLSIEEKDEDVEAIKVKLDADYASIANEMNMEWLRCIKEMGTGFETITATERQPDFFKNHIGTPKLKTAVIVCDALRYEMAVELLERLTGKKHVASLTAALAMLPTETKYCKPSLLPHKELVCTGTDMTVDGKVLDKTDLRTLHLQAYNDSAVCINYDVLMSLSKSEKREVFKNKLVYVFHNKLDDKCHGCSAETYASTCKDTIDQLVQLIAYIHDGANVTEVYLTADHGHLYNDIPFEEKDKMVVNEELAEKKTRYFISQDSKEEFGITKFPMQAVSTMKGDYFVGVPTGTNRIAKEGGDYQFAHGGGSLQELVIPVLHSKYKEFNKKQKVSVSLLEPTLTIVSSRLKAHLVQGEAVSMTMQEQTVECAVYVGDEAVTPIKTITLNSTDEEMGANRIYEVDLTVTQSATSKIMQFKVFKQEDPLNPVIVKNIVNNTLIEQDDF